MEMLFKNWLESLALKGDYKQSVFQQLVAGLYELSPIVDEKAIPAFKYLEEKIKSQYSMLQSRFVFNSTKDDPYKSVKDLSNQINIQKEKGIKKPEVRVFNGGQDHPIFSNDVNVMLRGVHDLIAHLAGMHPFSARGEYGAYNRHLKTLGNKINGNGQLAASALFTEIVGQTSYYYVYKKYPVQKAIILKDFDFYNVGALNKNSGLNEFFVLENKELIPINLENFKNKYGFLHEELMRQPNSFLANS